MRGPAGRDAHHSLRAPLRPRAAPRARLPTLGSRPLSSDARLGRLAPAARSAPRGRARPGRRVPGRRARPGANGGAQGPRGAANHSRRSAPPPAGPLTLGAPGAGSGCARTPRARGLRARRDPLRRRAEASQRLGCVLRAAPGAWATFVSSLAPARTVTQGAAAACVFMWGVCAHARVQCVCV